MTATHLMNEYMRIALHFLVCAMLLCGVVVWIQRGENIKQRRSLAATFLFGGIVIFLRLIQTYVEGIPPSGYQVLPILNLYGGLLFLLSLFFYPVAVVNPEWLKSGRVMVLVFPLIVVSLLLLIVQVEFRYLSSWHELWIYIREPNVWMRLLILVVFIIPYSVLLLFVPYNWRISSVDNRWIRIYVIGVQCIAALYTVFMLTGSVASSAAHLTFCSAFFLYVAYQELFIRLIPKHERKDVEVEIPVPIELPKDVYEESPQEVATVLWRKLEHYMRCEEPWRSPDITISEVAKAVESNRTTLSAEIRSQGYASFHDLVARYRIRAYCQMARNGKVRNINDAFFSVGFRSRTTAYERFKKETGMTPAEYVRKV